MFLFRDKCYFVFNKHMKLKPAALYCGYNRIDLSTLTYESIVLHKFGSMVI